VVDEREARRDGTPTLAVLLRAAGIAMLTVLAALFLLAPDNGSSLVRALELAAVVLLGVTVLSGVIAGLTRWLGGWSEGEAEFELRVQRAEQIAAGARHDDAGDLRIDPLRDEDFEDLVRDALDELPDLLQNALAHVAVVISDGGRRARAYGLYQGDGVHRDDHPDRIVIFRDTLRRDFGHDPDLLREQVVRVVRHELAHHVGFDELGVGELGL
jgi:predicted Zn-dependent protease with MMP-like domain